MTRIWTLLFVAALAGCGQGNGRPPGENRILVGPVTPPPPRVPVVHPTGPCVAPIEPGEEANCDFQGQERLTGIWVRGFEQSNFLWGETAIPDMNYAERDHYWLIFANGVEPDPAFRTAFNQVRGTAAAAVEFVGRRAAATPRSSAVVIVDRIISMRVLGEVGAR